jgi:hypothetical protein
MSNLIAVIKEGQEGGIHIDIEGKVVTRTIDRPEWADGYANAMLGERIGWYEQRLGTQLGETMRKPEILLADDLEWIGVDAEGSEVHIESNGETRMSILAGLLGVDLEDQEATAILKNSVVKGEVAHTYRTNPTNEETLGEIESQDFSEATRAAVAG